MFYENQSKAKQKTYKTILKKVGEFSRLFSDSDAPYLSYRIQENAFCYSFDMGNAARDDSAFDAIGRDIGVGLKTWVGSNDQKIAEFGKLLSQYKHLHGLDLVRQIATYRNNRITVSLHKYGIKTLVYHIVKRIPRKMLILEHAYDYIDVKHIKVIKNRGNENNVYFTDGKYVYHFSNAKHTLYMLFDQAKQLDSFSVSIRQNPFKTLLSTDKELAKVITQTVGKDMLCARIYSDKKKKGRKVPLKSGLNQWNATPRFNRKKGTYSKRNPNELYIPLNDIDKNAALNFFPSKYHYRPGQKQSEKKHFNLYLPDGTRLTASLCQAGSKAIMSNPNYALGKWLLRDVLGLKEGTLVTYDMLMEFGIDSVIITKIDDDNYRIDFADVGVYEKFYGLEEEEE